MPSECIDFIKWTNLLCMCMCTVYTINVHIITYLMENISLWINWRSMCSRMKTHSSRDTNIEQQSTSNNSSLIVFKSKKGTQWHYTRKQPISRMSIDANDWCCFCCCCSFFLFYYYGIYSFRSRLLCRVLSRLYMVENI